MAERTQEIRNHPTQDERKAAAAELWGNSTVRKQIRTPAREVLSRMAPGIDGCMYCGNHKSTDVEHFEPKSRNPLRAFCWHNYLLVCSECNSAYKGSKYPLDRLYQPLLIDPTVDDPFDHLRLVLPHCDYAWLTIKGKHTRDVLRLNDRRLPEARRAALRDMGTLLRGWTMAYEQCDEEWKEGIVLGIREHPFADVCQALLRQAEDVDAEIYFREFAFLLPFLRDPDLRAALRLPRTDRSG
ncbi:hypothetical protein [Streptomyces atratus]|uniref:hypothetical protein n=1 Tax=Streptomyces atratus TaxID=1893 RepID=UPI0032460E34